MKGRCDDQPTSDTGHTFSDTSLFSLRNKYMNHFTYISMFISKNLVDILIFEGVRMVDIKLTNNIHIKVCNVTFDPLFVDIKSEILWF